MVRQNIDAVLLEDIRIIFRNLSGKPTIVNQAGGDRGFSAVLTKDMYTAMAADGWNVKQRIPEDPDADTLYHLPVTVKYNNYPPSIWLVTSRGKTLLDEDTVGSIDYADILKVDLIVRPYSWEANGSSGIKAYVKSMFVTINEDELELKYSDYRDLGGNNEPTPPWDLEDGV